MVHTSVAVETSQDWRTRNLDQLMWLKLLGKQCTEMKWIHSELSVEVVTDRNWKVCNKPDIQFKSLKNE